MKFEITIQQRDFFSNEGKIEFEGLYTKKEVIQCAQQVRDVLAYRLKTSRELLNTIPVDKIYLAGRDLWRSESSIKNFVLKKSYADIVSELTGEKIVRIGFDQVFTSGINEDGVNLDVKTLDEYSSLQGCIAGLMICLSPPKRDHHVEEGISLFSPTQGNGVFFKPSFPIPLSEISNCKEALYLFIAYVRRNTVYCYQKDDLFSYHWKSLGYNFGDKLSDLQNPVLHR